MKKVLLLLVVVGGLAMLDPGIRGSALRLTGPIGAAIQKGVARNAAGGIADDIAWAADQEGSYPPQGSLSGWLESRDKDNTDPWGSSYYLELFADSFVVISPGPDEHRGTEDDVRVARRRAQPAAATSTDDFEPRPPPSSAARAGKSKALEAARRH